MLATPRAIKIIGCQTISYRDQRGCTDPDHVIPLAPSAWLQRGGQEVCHAAAKLGGMGGKKAAVMAIIPEYVMNTYEQVCTQTLVLTESLLRGHFRLD